MNNKTAEEILRPYVKNVSSGFGTWEMIDLDKARLSMEEYASPLKKRIEELEAENKRLTLSVDGLISIIDKTKPSTNGKQD